MILMRASYVLEKISWIGHYLFTDGPTPSIRGPNLEVLIFLGFNVYLSQFTLYLIYIIFKSQLFNLCIIVNTFVHPLVGMACPML